MVANTVEARLAWTHCTGSWSRANRPSPLNGLPLIRPRFYFLLGGSLRVGGVAATLATMTAQLLLALAASCQPDQDAHNAIAKQNKKGPPAHSCSYLPTMWTRSRSTGAMDHPSEHSKDQSQLGFASIAPRLQSLEQLVDRGNNRWLILDP